MKATILSVGDELILGQTVDTNSAWLSRQLAAIGFEVRGHVTVADDQAVIEGAIEQLAGGCDVLLISGGIGPTADDLTRQALAAVMNVPLELNEAWLAEMAEFFRQRRRPMPDSNRIQAMIPRGARMIFNTAGTAAGIAARVGECRVFIMPGVPREMMVMFNRDVLPEIQAMGNGSTILSRSLHTFGLGESSVAEMLGDLMRRDRNPSVGTTVSAGVVSLRINARFDNREEARRQLDATTEACRQAMGDLVYGEDETTLAAAVAALLKQAPDGTVATAESCTGGLLAKMLTDIPGSSIYFRQGWITYSNEAKQAMLGVEESVLREHGAVSEPVVLAMARGARQRSGCKYALAISGIAGPDGGTPVKPVGTVCIALADDAGETARMFCFPGDREMIRLRAANTALLMLRYRILRRPLPV